MSLLDDAADWHKANPEARLSEFACRYPGQYREASNALRKIRHQEGYYEADNVCD